MKCATEQSGEGFAAGADDSYTLSDQQAGAAARRSSFSYTGGGGGGATPAGGAPHYPRSDPGCAAPPPSHGAAAAHTSAQLALPAPPGRGAGSSVDGQGGGSFAAGTPRLRSRRASAASGGFGGGLGGEAQTWLVMECCGEARPADGGGQ